MPSASGCAMPLWSSPFPCNGPSNWQCVDFPGPKGSILLFDSPDKVLQHWGCKGTFDGAELERIEQGCQKLLQLKQSGGHSLKPCWLDGEPPRPDGIIAALLMLTLQAAPNCLQNYLQLDPNFLSRLLHAQSHPRQLLQQWITKQHQFSNSESPLDRQLNEALRELDSRFREQQRIETLLDQHRDQQRRTRHLLVKLIKAQE